MDIEQTAIARLKEAAHMSEKVYGLPLLVTTSGGKDSGVVVELARRAGIPFEVMHNHTTADAPETVYFVRQELARLEAEGIKCTVGRPTYKGRAVSMWTLIPQKLMPPTRIARYCCEVLKEGGGRGRMITTGVRWAESVKRKNNRGLYELNGHRGGAIILNNDNDDRRRLFERCTVKSKMVCNPIIDWTERDVWEYTRACKIPVNPLYGCGFDRVGCIGCPLAGKKRYKEFNRYPKYKRLYLLAFEKMLEERARRGKLEGSWNIGTTAQAVFDWWMEDKNIEGQISMDDIADEEAIE